MGGVHDIFLGGLGTYLCIPVIFHAYTNDHSLHYLVIIQMSVSPV